MPRFGGAFFLDSEESPRIDRRDVFPINPLGFFSFPVECFKRFEYFRDPPGLSVLLCCLQRKPHTQGRG